MEYLNAFVQAFTGMLNWIWGLITFNPNAGPNYFWGLIAISSVVWVLELLFPWRKKQSAFR